jgi:hypothetical protein
MVSIIGPDVSGVLAITKSARGRGGHGCREDQQNLAAAQRFN